MTYSRQDDLNQRGKQALLQTSQTDHEPGLQDISWGSLLGGTAILAYGLFGSNGITRLFLSGVGAGLIYHGLDKNNMLGPGLKRLLLHTGATQEVQVQSSITVRRPLEEVYELWRGFETLPLYLSHIQSITPIDADRARWSAKLPAGLELEWEALIVEERAQELLVWKSVEGSDLYNEGYITFRPALGGEATEIYAQITYRPPAGEAGARVAGFFDQVTARVVKEDLRRFKTLLEAEQSPALKSSIFDSDDENGRMDDLQ